MKPIKISELIETLECQSDEHTTRVDLQEGCVVMVESSVLSAVEESDEESLTLPEWQEAELKIAQAIVTDSSERFIEAPDKFEFHEYRHMERFIEEVANDRAAERLWRAIRGKGAFRHFKDTASDLGLLEDWYGYRETAMKEFVVTWAKAREIPLVDDSRRCRDVDSAPTLIY